MLPEPLTPGPHEVRLVLGGDAVPTAEPVGAEWDASRMPLVAHYGLVLWSASHAQVAGSPSTALGRRSHQQHGRRAIWARAWTSCPWTAMTPLQPALRALRTGEALGAALRARALPGESV